MRHRARDVGVEIAALRRTHLDGDLARDVGLPFAAADADQHHARRW